jgi:AcrR family transcriptional regulator
MHSHPAPVKRKPPDAAKRARGRAPARRAEGVAAGRSVRRAPRSDAAADALTVPRRGRAGPPERDGPAASAHPARQARSRRTLDRLLAAAEAVLGERGLDAATVPEIASRAGLSVGVVYRRFPDKDALMRAVYERAFERVRRFNRAILDPELWRDMSLEQFAAAMIGGMSNSYRSRAALLRPLLLYSLTHRDARFQRRTYEANDEAMALATRLVLAHRADITHRHPERAARFALLAISLVLSGMVLAGIERFDAMGPPAGALPHELTRMFLAYLGATPDDPTPRGHRASARRART